jgi:hypothetical protein
MGDLGIKDHALLASTREFTEGELQKKADLIDDRAPVCHIDFSTSLVTCALNSMPGNIS